MLLRTKLFDMKNRVGLFMHFSPSIVQQGLNFFRNLLSSWHYRQDTYSFLIFYSLLKHWDSNQIYIPQMILLFTFLHVRQSPATIGSITSLSVK